jgi:E3 ubiquitin-protein ligase RNF13
MSGVSELPATEATPLLSSSVQLPSQPSSFRSSVAASPPRPMSRQPSSHSVSRAYSVSSTPQSPSPFRSHTNLPGIHTSRSTADLANMSSPHPRISHLSSTHSLVGSHLSPPISIRYSLPQLAHSGHGSSSPHVSSPYILNSRYGSSSYYYLGGSSQHGSCLRRCGESGPSLSTMAARSPQQSTAVANVAVGTSSAQSLRQSYLRGCGESDASLSDMLPAQSLPQQFQSEANVAAGTSSAQSLRQSYLRCCGDSDASLSDMTSAQSLPGC